MPSRSAVRQLEVFCCSCCFHSMNCRQSGCHPETTVLSGQPAAPGAARGRAGRVVPSSGGVFASGPSQICIVTTTVFWQMAVKCPEEEYLFLMHREALSGLTEARKQPMLMTQAFLNAFIKRRKLRSECLGPPSPYFPGRPRPGPPGWGSAAGSLTDPPEHQEPRLCSC